MHYSANRLSMPAISSLNCCHPYYHTIHPGDTARRTELHRDSDWSERCSQLLNAQTADVSLMLALERLLHLGQTAQQQSLL